MGCCASRPEGAAGAASPPSCLTTPPPPPQAAPPPSSMACTTLDVPSEPEWCTLLRTPVVGYPRRVASCSS